MDVSLCKCCFVVPEKSTKSQEYQSSEGVTSVTMAYVVLIHLMLVCPLIRLLSISMKDDAKRVDRHLLGRCRRQRGVKV